MEQIRKFFRAHWRFVGLVLLSFGIVSGLLIYRLGSLVGGLSSGEVAVARTPLGWHGLYQQPLYFPLKLVRSLLFFFFDPHGQTVTRLGNVAFGLVAIASFAAVMRLWHARRTTILSIALFATSAWVLHVSRLASFDVLYLMAVPVLMLGYALRQRYTESSWVFYGTALSWAVLAFVPGLIWLVLVSAALSWRDIYDCWLEHKAWWKRTLFVLLSLSWAPLLVRNFINSGADFQTWLGLPESFPPITTLGKQLAGVPVHLFVHGPEMPDLWLGRLPILDVFTLALTIMGGYFYFRHWRAQRARQLALMLVVGTILVALGGPVPLSLLVPILFLTAAAGLNSLLHNWLQVFPLNPFARGLGISLITLAVAVSCIYNIRSYFVAWPHNETTQAAFSHRR